MTSLAEPDYLLPYRLAAAEHGASFRTLLWASPRTQRIRFEAIARACDLNGRSLLDVGCGRADLFGYLRDSGIVPAEYTGIEAVAALADAAEALAGPAARILRTDFVREPSGLFVGADVVIFSGSLNTLDAPSFYATLRAAFEAAGEAIVFNFLSSPLLAGRQYLLWREPDDVLKFARSLTPHATVVDDYLRGDCTIAMTKSARAKVRRRG